MRPDIAPGTFPDYQLPDHMSVPRKLSEIQRDYSSFHGWDKRAGATPSSV
jgi:hypothetical protein